MLLQVVAAGDADTIHSAGPHFPNIHHHFYSLSSSSPFVFFSPELSVCPVSRCLLCVCVCLSLSLSLRLPFLFLFFSCRSPISRPSCCVHFLFILYSDCYIIYIWIRYIRSDMFLFTLIFVSSLFVSLFSLSSHFLSSSTRPTLSRTLSPCEPGPAQGLFLFPRHWAHLGSGAGFLPLQSHFIVKGAKQIGLLELNNRATV